MSDLSLLEKFVEGLTEPVEDEILCTNPDGFRDALVKKLREIDIELINKKGDWKSDKISFKSFLGFKAAMVKKKSRIVEILQVLNKEIATRNIEKAAIEDAQRRVDKNTKLDEVVRELRGIREYLENRWGITP